MHGRAVRFCFALAFVSSLNRNLSPSTAAGYPLTIFHKSMAASLLIHLVNLLKRLSLPNWLNTTIALQQEILLAAGLDRNPTVASASGFRRGAIEEVI